jgi:hypothetical protein
MKNFIPRWLHFIPRFSQIKRTLEMCHSRSAAGHCCWFSESAQIFSNGLEILAPQSFKLRNGYVRKYLNAKVPVNGRDGKIQKRLPKTPELPKIAEIEIARCGLHASVPIIRRRV